MNDVMHNVNTFKYVIILMLLLLLIRNYVAAPY